MGLNVVVISKSFHLFVIILLYYGAKVSFFREKTKKKCIFLEHVQYILLSGIYLHLFNCQKLA